MGKTAWLLPGLNRPRQKSELLAALSVLLLRLLRVLLLLLLPCCRYCRWPLPCVYSISGGPGRLGAACLLRASGGCHRCVLKLNSILLRYWYCWPQGMTGRTSAANIPKPPLCKDYALLHCLMHNSGSSSSTPISQQRWKTTRPRRSFLTHSWLGNASNGHPGATAPPLEPPCFQGNPASPAASSTRPSRASTSTTCCCLCCSCAA